jgi:hypothetical protein
MREKFSCHGGPANKQGADSSSRLGDLTPRNPHYQTAGPLPVNCLKNAPIVKYPQQNFAELRRSVETGAAS